jgi:hypothetical protein
MPYPSNAPLITADNVDALCGLPGKGSVTIDGQVRLLNFRAPKVAYGCARGVKADAISLLPRDVWHEWVEKKDAAKSWLIDNVADIPCKDQNGLGYCHAYGTASTIEGSLVMAGYPYEELSAESIGGPVTGWRNAGADPQDDLEQAINHGVCLAKYMDAPHSINPKYWQGGWEKDAATRTVKEFWDLRIPGKSFDAIVTCALLNTFVGLGYQWWGHFVHGVYQVRRNAKTRKWEILLRNSWGPDYGDNGFFWLEEGTGRNQGTPDWAFAVRVVEPQDETLKSARLALAI